MNRIGLIATVIIVTIEVATAADAHTIRWPRGMSHQVGFGHCAKGPCMKRSSFSPYVPHRHIGKGECEGMGAGGYRFGGRFAC